MFDISALAIPIGTLIIASAAVLISSRNVRETAETNAFNAVLTELNLERTHRDRQDLAIKKLENEVVSLKDAVDKCEKERAGDVESHRLELLILYRKLNAIEERKL